jgi:hypothetical protein
VAVSEAPAGNERQLEGLARLAKKDEVGDIALANMASAFKAIDAKEVDAEFNGALLH